MSNTLFISGAGISQAAQLRTYRGEDGLYPHRIPDCMTEEGMRFRSIASWRIQWPWFVKMANAEPTDTHHALAQYCKNNPESLVITQNVDGLHYKSGLHSAVELHGTIRHGYCATCQEVTPISLVGANMEGEPDWPRLHCPRCSQVMRPHIVGYGGSVSDWLVTMVQDQIDSVDFSEVVIIGTTLEFSYLIDFIEELAHRGVLVTVIDPDDSPVLRLAERGLVITHIDAKADEGFSQWLSGSQVVVS
ncbi:NAD-dependent deacetylase [Vibrio splendidus]